MSRRVHYITVRLYDGKPSSIIWSPPREEWSPAVRLMAEGLRNEMVEDVADTHKEHDEEGR